MTANFFVFFFKNRFFLLNYVLLFITHDLENMEKLEEKNHCWDHNFIS